jgi:Tol biopolymer transport system component
MTPPEQIAHYRISAKLGEGGMGEVYRATDTKLGREVAIKVLPESFAQDAGRMARFEREAQVLASLNHPNIAQIYGVEDRALVMELVEGDAPKGPMPFDDAWHIALQITAGLEYAHERGIVHRDLKPANIKVTQDGVVKLLDFGLAKAFSNLPEASANPEVSPTLTIGPTEVGVVLGTAAYMAPEQAKGKSVDKRADIWAFGVVLYEILTGKRPFHGEDVTETLASVIKEEPDLKPVPADARRLLKSCLTKDPKKRLRDIGDAWRLLDDAASPAPESRALPVWAGWIVGIAALTGAAVLGLIHFREAPPEPPVYTYTIGPPENSAIRSFAISPDGKSVAIAAIRKGKRSLWVRRLDSLEMNELAGAEGAQDPFWSPDGHEIAFFRGIGNSLRKISASGGPTEALLQPSINGGTWNRNGVILVGGLDGMRRISSGGGASSVVISNKSPLTWPAFLPDGRRFLYRIGQPDSAAGVYLSSLDSKETKRVLPDAARAVFLSPPYGGRFGYLFFVRERVLLGQPVDSQTLQLAGEPLQIAKPIADPISGFSISEAGTLVYRAGANADAELRWFDRSGMKLGIAAEPGSIYDFGLSPDEKRLLVSRTNSSGGRDLWLQDLVHGTASRFTLDPSSNFRPVWSRDGQFVAFSSTRSGRTDLYLKSAAGTIPEKLIFATKESAKSGNDWTPDGRLLLFQDIILPATMGLDLFALPVGGGDRIPIVQGTANQTKAQLSPDGRWLAYVSDESGREEVYVQSFAIDGKPAAQRWHISASGGTDPRWRRDGRELFYLAADENLMAVPVNLSGSSFTFGAAQSLFDVGPISGPVAFGSFRYAASSDGKRFLILKDAGTPAPSLLTVVTNWRASVKK